MRAGTCDRSTRSSQPCRSRSRTPRSREPTHRLARPTPRTRGSTTTSSQCRRAQAPSRSLSKAAASPARRPCKKSPSRRDSCSKIPPLRSRLLLQTSRRVRLISLSNTRRPSSLPLLWHRRAGGPSRRTDPTRQTSGRTRSPHPRRSRLARATPWSWGPKTLSVPIVPRR